MKRLGSALFVCSWLGGCGAIAGIDDFDDQLGLHGSGATGGATAHGGGGTSSVGGSQAQAGATDTAAGGSAGSQTGSASGGSGSEGSTTGAGGEGDVVGGGGSGPSAPVPPSCEQLPATCGADADDDCCANLLVSGDTFYRDYDGVNDVNDDFPATVSDFRLDRYEIVVGRFRAFAAAWIAGWRPALGDGKHAHLNGGSGLSGADGSYEPGWDNTWNNSLATSGSDWDANLGCDASATWTSSAGDNENKPLNCIAWYEAEAFCIWDGGFLPSEAEWNIAATGGAEQRYYPWSDPPTSVGIDCSRANYSVSFPSDSCVGALGVAGAQSPAGDGRYGHADLAGSLWELVLDWYDLDYLVPCVDCARLDSNQQYPQRQMRGGSYTNASSAVRVNGLRGSSAPATRDRSVGARCARSP